MTPKRRFRIGLLATELSDYNDRDLFFGLTELAKDLDFNLIYFHGSRLKDPIGYNAQGNIIYSFIGKENLDALIIWTTALCRFNTPEETRAFCTSFHPIPVVGIGAPLPGIPSILVDSYQGMYDIIDHLIVVHGHKRIAFIQGPQSHYDSQERFRAYKNVLSAHGIPFDPGLVSDYGDWNISHGKASVKLFLDERKTDFSAIVGSSFLFAHGAVMELTERGIRVPDEIAIVAYDDKPLCRTMDPPMSTVPIMLYERGRIAGRLAMDLLAGRQVPITTTVSAHPVYRRSCGCTPLTSLVTSSWTIPVLPEQNMDTQALQDIRRDILEKIQMVNGPGTSVSSAGWAGELVESYLSGISSGNPGVFASTLGPLFCEHRITALYMQKWHLFIEAFAPRAEWGLSGLQLAVCAEMRLRASKYLHESEVHTEMSKWLKMDDHLQTLVGMGLTLTTIFTVHELTDILAEELPKLNIPSCFLCLYSDPKTPAIESRMVLASIHGNRIDTEYKPDDTIFPTRQILPNDLLNKYDFTTLLLEPLYYKENQLGYVIFEIGPGEVSLYAILRSHITSVLWGAINFEKQKKAEESLATQTRELIRSNEELEQFAFVVAHELQEPLRKISVYGQRLSEPLDEQSAEYTKRMIMASDRMKKLINDLLAYSRVTRKPHDFSEVNLGYSVNDALTDLEIQIREANAEVILSALPIVEAVPFQIRELFLNLVGNAIKYRDKKRKCAIRIYEENPSPEMRRIIVEDNGIGIKKEYQEKVFGFFVQLHKQGEYSGSGIGLTICRRIMERHNGSITIESTLGVGTKVIILIPEKQHSNG